MQWIKDEIARHPDREQRQLRDQRGCRVKRYSAYAAMSIRCDRHAIPRVFRYALVLPIAIDYYSPILRLPQSLVPPRLLGDIITSVLIHKRASEK
ncbi:MAG TPA: hypothetical protein VGL01_01130 [Trinickia sp.]|uniref:hypothetical protein n=1 Tax=Trinickia sp. TaxID=2571163 RepID=UPI002F401007